MRQLIFLFIRPNTEASILNYSSAPAIPYPRTPRSTQWMKWMAHRKRKETKQQPGTAGPGNILGCCLVSLSVLWDIHSVHPVVGALVARVNFSSIAKSHRLRVFSWDEPSKHNALWFRSLEPGRHFFSFPHFYGDCFETSRLRGENRVRSKGASIYNDVRKIFGFLSAGGATADL